MVHNTNTRNFKGKQVINTAPPQRESRQNYSASIKSENNSSLINSVYGGNEPLFYLYLKEDAASVCDKINFEANNDTGMDFKPLPQGEPRKPNRNLSPDDLIGNSNEDMNRLSNVSKDFPQI
jgi:hypothetical protein